MRIKVLRAMKDLTQGELARIAGVSPCTINLIERGKRQNITPKTMIKIARALGVYTFEIDEFNYMGNY